MTAVVIWIMLLALIFVGVPIACTMGISSILLLLIENPASGTLIVQKAFGGLDVFTLMAIPMFILAAELMNAAEVGTKIFDFANVCVRHITGGLAQVNILASVIMAGMSGAAVCDISGIGALEIKAMEANGYDRDFSAAITAASSALGPIIPPSIPAVLVGSIMSVSVSDMLIGGIIPGLLMVVVMGAICVYMSKKRGYPTFPKASRQERLKSFWTSLPALLMPVILLGTIMGGVSTPTEGACIASLYALFLGVIFYRNVGLKKLVEVFENCAMMTANIMFITSMAAVFGLVLTQEQIPQMLTSLIVSLTDNKYVILFLINMLLLVLGCMLESNSIYIVLTPILMQVCKQYGIDLIHFGVMMCMNVTIGLYTPPVGVGMYLTCKVANITTKQFMKATWPFLVALFLATLLVAYCPPIVTWLPSVIN